MGCVIEDDKVMIDDIYDRILAWEDDVQSVDTVSMQKLWCLCNYKHKYYIIIWIILKYSK